MNVEWQASRDGCAWFGTPEGGLPDGRGAVVRLDRSPVLPGCWIATLVVLSAASVQMGAEEVARGVTLEEAKAQAEEALTVYDAERRLQGMDFRQELDAGYTTGHGLLTRSVTT